MNISGFIVIPTATNSWANVQRPRCQTHESAVKPATVCNNTSSTNRRENERQKESKKEITKKKHKSLPPWNTTSSSITLADSKKNMVHNRRANNKHRHGIIKQIFSQLFQTFHITCACIFRPRKQSRRKKKKKQKKIGSNGGNGREPFTIFGGLSVWRTYPKLTVCRRF